MNNVTHDRAYDSSICLEVDYIYREKYRRYLHIFKIERLKKKLEEGKSDSIHTQTLLYPRDQYVLRQEKPSMQKPNKMIKSEGC